MVNLLIQRRKSNSNTSIIYIYIFVQIMHLTCSLPSKTNDTKFGVWMERSPESTVAPNGDEVLFECEINIIPDNIEWRFRHVSVSNDFHGYQIMSGNNITNDDNMSKLRIYVSPETIGEYQCVAWFGTSALASVAAQLSLATINEIYKNDVLRNYQNPDEASKWKVAPKNSLLIKCGSIVSNPAPVWSFYKNNIPVIPIDSNWPPGSLVLNNVTSKDTGIYSCSAMNSITGQEIKLKHTIDLTVDYTQRMPPYFLTQPATKVLAHPGQTIVLECPGVGNPNPKAVWSSPKIFSSYTPNNRTTIFPYGLQIIDVKPEDNGTYTCRLDNGLLPVLVHVVKLQVLQKPTIVRGPGLSLANESFPWELECQAKGTPPPVLYWMINGVDTRTDSTITHHEGSIIISNMKKAYAGIVQCFAKNDAGETVNSNLLQVNPTQVNSSILGQFPTQSILEHRPTKKKKHKSPTMIPPNKPSVSRLSDDSVMLRWSVPKNDGLEITFFKVQYKMLDRSKTTSRGNWETTNEEISFGKRDNKVKNFTIPVSGLQPDRYYRFRILAVYSNNDNKEGPSTGKFLLQSGETLGKDKGYLPAPVLSTVEGISENIILLNWDYPDNIYIEGFYVHYRSVLSAGEYTKQTVEGMRTRKFNVDNLEANTAYEFKLQSFTLSAASDFSSILTGRTTRITTSPPYIKNINIVPEHQTIEKQSYFIIIAGTAGGSALILLAVVLLFVLYRWKKSDLQNEDKPRIDHIQADGHLVPSMHKNNHRLNGVMNITPNPLAHDGDKIQHQRGSSPYHHFNKASSNSTNSPTILHKQLTNNHAKKTSSQYKSSLNNIAIQVPITPDFNRRILDKSNRSLHYSPSPPVYNNALPIENLTNRVPSLRINLTRHTSCNENVGAPGSPQIRKSPKGIRQTHIVRNHTSNLSKNMSSGSLNSIEV
ncbi:interference hedgehog isoform X2 [Condylostylus longicornis]|uniref:interference hedgehog isoform X2 n=1 Tax=Condylostylus longicornis TaxID=2530218 RepID=UPI00244E3A90|nr:interference hedgehog isoform X2 [Condylostylus longicornis]